ncbi:putative prolyl-tRNA synthetase associated domain-containing protein 1 [Lytechinus variegatus]|uniref:putative prolyl-tRNA synthetase associated domain-containing protein 1 n=1 Tax=Lytechinus variegatus TaxID=7654 RepID=UPI001BB2D05B|nr:putative prolyl-tRNA synthetase associated domain-containing protein 1 [Lytechinus variegatus]
MASEDNQATASTNGGREELIALFDRLGIAHETTEHPEVFTVEAMMPHIQHLTGAFCKNLFLKDKKKKLYLLTAHHDRPIQLNAVSKKVGASGGLRLADESILKEKLGVTQGCVTPYAIFNDTAGDVKFILDSDVVNGGHEKLFGHPMVNTASTAISPADLMKFAKEMGHEPILLDFSDM